MNQKITKNINIKVETFFQPERGRPSQDCFLFQYQITIENLGPHPVQLMSRHWQIQDSVGVNQEVQGDGVVGVQPILLPDESYRYSSAVTLKSELGKMSGKYTMRNLHTDELFEALIPEFKLAAPYKLN